MTDYESSLLRYLQSFLTPQRRDRFTEVLSLRVHPFATVLVDMFQSRNASAVLRSCDAFGVQHVSIVEQEDNLFRLNSEVALGSQQWLTMNRYRGKAGFNRCLETFRKHGFRIASMVLREDSCPLESVPVDAPLALIFGNEKDGVPEEAIEASDLLVHIPMFGFVESFNVSVAAALAFQILIPKIRNSGSDWQLPAETKQQLLLDWTRKSIPNCDAIERRFRDEWEIGVNQSESPDAPDQSTSP